MFDGIGKVFLWALAIVGGVVVVRKYGPRLMSRVRESRLGIGSGKATGALPMRAGAAVLVPCGPGGNPGPAGYSPKTGVQSSAFYRWCYLVRSGDTTGTIAERIAGDSARYAEILVANPAVAKKGKMGTVVGPDAWDFADGSLNEGTKILVPQTMNAWIDQLGNATGGYLPWPPDPRAIVEAEGHEIVAGEPPPVSIMDGDSMGSGAGEPEPIMDKGPPIGISTTKGYQRTSWSDGFDYEGAV